MKVKTSVTLSERLLAAIDEVAGEGCNRSAILEEAASDWVRRKRRAEDDRHDAEIYARLTPEQIAESDVLDYSVDPFELGDDIELLPEVEARLAAEDTHHAAG
jgi:hypothetical protein